MGFIQKLFGTTSETVEEKTLPWIGLTKESQLLSLENNSETKNQLIFKHSTRCGISRMVMNQFVASFEVDENVELYYLDVLDYRDLSRAVASKFQVLHESPQVLLIKNGVVVTHASHGAINNLDWSEFI